LDRFSWIPALASDTKDTQETKSGLMRVYQGGSAIDEDIIYKQNDSQIFLPSGNAAIIAILIEYAQQNNSFAIRQPQAVFYYQGNQVKIPLRYAYYNSMFFDFKTGLEGTADIIPRAEQTGQGVQIDNQGVALYISPRVMRGMMAQIYLLNDPFKNFQNFKLAHSEPSIIIDSLKNQGAGITGDFLFFGDVQGPIKIWNIKYAGDEKVNPDYLITSPPPTIDWQF
jgi:hypothetical protein